MRELKSLATVALAAAVVACTTNNAPEPDPGGGGAVHVTVETDRSIYDEGDDVTVTLTAHNMTDDPVTLDFNTGQRYDFVVENAAGESVWTWSATRGFTQALGQETLEPGAERAWSEVVEPPLEPGEYTAVGMVTNTEGPLVDRVDFTVR